MSITPEWQPRFTIEQVRGFSDAELENMSTGDLIDARLLADQAGEEDLAMKIFSKMPLAPESLLAAKETFGAAWIRQHNLNTSRADAEYGSQWLDA